VKIGPQSTQSSIKSLLRSRKKNGQSQRFLLEKAIEHYIHTVVPSQHTVRPEVMEAFRRSNEKFPGAISKAGGVNGGNGLPDRGRSSSRSITS